MGEGEREVVPGFTQARRIMQVVVAPWHTTRVPTAKEKAAGPECGSIFIEEDEFGLLHDKDGFVVSDFEGEVMTGLAKTTARLPSPFLSPPLPPPVSSPVFPSPPPSSAPPLLYRSHTTPDAALVASPGGGHPRL